MADSHRAARGFDFSWRKSFSLRARVQICNSRRADPSPPAIYKMSFTIRDAPTRARSRRCEPPVSIPPAPANNGEPVVNSFLAQLAANARDLPDRPALWIKQTDGQFAAIDWRTIYGDVLATAELFRSLKMDAGKRVVHIAENRYEWIVVDLALLAVRAVHVPLHASAGTAQLASAIRHCAPSFILVADEPQTAHVTEVARSLPSPPAIFSYHGLGLPDRRALPAHANPQPQPPTNVALPETAAAEPSVSTILYTSGTSGAPKGVMLTEHNLLANARAVLAAFGGNPDELRFNLLPFSHVFARTCDLYVWILERSQMALAASRDTVLDDCRKVWPTLINAVPYFFEKVLRGLRERGLDQHAGSLRMALGGRVRVCNSGGAALSESLIAAYRRHGLPLLQGYGLTEASPVVSACTVAADVPGSVGRALPGVEVRLAADRELLVRGPNVMLGYLDNHDATATVLVDGWLQTGDLASIDDQGFIRIVGRKRDILVLTNGKNVAPAMLESQLCQHPLIAQAVVVGDGRKHLAALIVPNLGAEANADGELRTRIQTAIDEQLRDLPRHEQIRRWLLLPQPLTVEAGELTPKLSLRRDAIVAKYAAAIEQLYADSSDETSPPKP